MIILVAGVIILITLLNIMSSMKSYTEDTKADNQDSNYKLLTHLKTYSFFVFYQPTHSNIGNPSLQKMNFKLRNERASEVQDSRLSDGNRSVSLHFYNLQSETESMQGLLDLKAGEYESKVKIVAYSSQDGLIQLLHQAEKMKIDITNIPIILSHSHPNSDLSIFSGWSEAQEQDFNKMSIGKIEQLAKKWIQSSQQKVDVWTVTFDLEQNGRIQKLVGKTYETIELASVLSVNFLSHFSLGYHVKLSKSYNQKCRQSQTRKMNKAIYGWQRFKNFCCLGTSSLQSSTGVVNIVFKDQKRGEIQILKQLRQYEGQSDTQGDTSKVIKDNKGILSLVVANIDRYQGHQLGQDINCKPGDGKAQIIIFEGVNKCRRLASVGGEIVFKIQSESAVELQVGETVYRCWGCHQLRIKQSGRIKISMNKDVLEC